MDPQRLRQVLLNLLANALKFTPRGRIGVHAGVEATSRHAQALLLTVWDTGNGISAADQERLFKRFSQVGVAGWQQSQGTGLGLSISRELARLMGGELTVRSEPGSGSSFQLELALVQPAAPARAFAPDGPPALPPGRRVLLVEDNAINQMVAEALLQRLGVAEVVTAADGAQALALCESHAFDLVLMDCQMPVMDGFEATRQLRARGCRWPIVALTAGGVTQDRDACLAAGMDDYLAKPIDDKLLGRVLQRWAGGEPPGLGPVPPAGR
ncbi:response regulator [Ramlibacter rhizophilus]|uniref:response regulator n=1 Tax=Ramlibacter rhizophilus TaxID=1781167 RepID=UPI00143247B9|nr:response regulator [Ramlibacter rhizophilus]